MSTHPTKVLAFDATETTLPNGLQVIVIPTGFPNLVSLQVSVQTGSRNEVEPGLSGFAHFFEHMMFRGTEAFPPERYQAAMTLAGARANAYTTDDYTNYHATFAKDDLEAVLAMEADRFQRLLYAPEAFKTEARAVLGEYNKNAADPGEKLYEVLRDKAFTAHTYKHTTMGFLADIEDMPNQFEYSRTFFDRWYRPEYATLIVAGDVAPREVLAHVEKHWGGWKRGNFRVDVPREPAPAGPVYAHVPWETPTLPLLYVAFHGPAFSETARDFAAIDALIDLWFGPTSDVHRRLVEREQKVDQLDAYIPPQVDPSLFIMSARAKSAALVVDVRDQLLAEAAKARTVLVDPAKLREAQSHARYALARRLDNTDAVAALVARYAHFRRAYGTLDAYMTRFDALTPEDLREAARTYLTDARLVVASLAHEALPPAMANAPALATLEPARQSASAAASESALRVLEQPSALPQLCVKLLFAAGSAHDPQGKEGLAALAAAMVAKAGSRALRFDEIQRVLFPIAGGFSAQVDREMTTFTGVVHKDNWELFADTVLPQLLEPGLRDEDFRRLRDAQRSALTVDLRGNNDEELGKERLQATVFAGTPYGHPALGTQAGIDAITLDDVRAFLRTAYTTGNLTVGIAGDAPPAVQARLRRDLARLAGPALSPPRDVTGARARGMQVEIVAKDTRATAISFGHPIDVTRSHPDFVALSVARAWLGEHRSSMSHLYQRIREIRGLNYGDYAYIEAFPGGMFQFFPAPNLARRAQLFEVWIRPVQPQNAHMALRLAVHELEQLIARGLSEEDFEAARKYLAKNVFVVTATQDARLGYALDSAWYGTPEYTAYVRDGLAKLTREDVHRAVKKHLSAKDLTVTVVAPDAEALREKLVSEAFSPLVYDVEKDAALVAEDKAIGAKKLGVTSVVVTRVDEVFAR